ncbi:MAG TPA: class I tRNA ligase family protein, partial [Armatimonadota bacterium]|nr:class I tRNA ligase family protein [Armatimonadota bacterium]
AMAAQRAQAIRLGVRADWDAPYLTTQPTYESTVLRVLRALVARELIYQAPMPVRWCPACQASLSDAEVEARARETATAHVALPVLRLPRWLFPGEDRARMAAAIWTGQPWALPAAVAVTLHPETSYALVTDRADPEGFAYLVARDRVRPFGHAIGMREPFVLGEALGQELEALVVLHPLTGRELPVLLAGRETADPRTGIEVVSPGTDHADYALARGRDLPVLPIITDQGRMAARTGTFADLTVAEARHAILQQLDRDGVLLSYRLQEMPAEHCWRCGGPLITRAMPHWFLRVAPLRDRLREAADSIAWHPAWGRARMLALLADRPDWCLSRQRAWGIPIPALVCAGCGERLLTPAVVGRAAEVVEVDGADAWWSRPARAFTPEGFACPRCGGARFRKAREIVDVWFESACSPAALALQHPELAWPADLALEGQDQYRGWFGLTLLVAAALEQPPPFRAVVSHGFVLARAEDGPDARDPGPDPQAAVAEHGADILRWWAALTDARADTRVAGEDLARAARVYRRLRAAARSLLGHLYDFLPDSMLLPETALEDADRWALGQVRALVAQATAAFEGYRPHQAAHALVAFCAALTARYLPLAHDRLLLAAPDAPTRRAAQTTCYLMAETLARLLAPLLSFTAEELWRCLPPATGRPASPQLAPWPTMAAAPDDAERRARWALVWAARRVVREALAAATMAAPRRGKVILYLAGEFRRLLEIMPETLAAAFGVAEVACASGDDAPDEAVRGRDGGLAVTAAPAAATRCPRCRHWRPVGGDAAFPDLCAACADAVGAAG